MKKCCGTCKHYSDEYCRCVKMVVECTQGERCGFYARQVSNTKLTFEKYQAAAKSTAKYLLSVSERIQRGALGIAGEAGEIAELIKKNQYQDKPLDYDVLADEMGDLLWYLAVLADDLDIGLCNIAARNTKKLEERYPDGYETLSSKI